MDEHWRPTQSPLVMGGVSMGGMISILTVMREPDMWKVWAEERQVPLGLRGPVHNGAILGSIISSESWRTVLLTCRGCCSCRRP